jgi:hypothetical protein
LQAFYEAENARDHPVTITEAGGGLGAEGGGYPPRVQPTTAKFLERLLRDMREIGRSGPDRAIQERLPHAGGALEALRAVGAIDQDECDRWVVMFWNAANGGGVPDEPAPPAERSLGRFRRLLVGSDSVGAYAGGSLRVIAVEDYEFCVGLQWLISTEDESALDALPPDAGLTDDRGRDYLPVGQEFHGTLSAIHGRAFFRPGLEHDVATLDARVGGHRFLIDARS